MGTLFIVVQYHFLAPLRNIGYGFVGAELVLLE
jgi:hypothetical protein